jgi:hypothetical protein
MGISQLISFFEGVKTQDTSFEKDAKEFIEHEEKVIEQDIQDDIQKEIERIEKDIASGHYRDEVRKIRDDVQYDALKEVLKISKDTLVFLKREIERTGDIELRKRVDDLEKRLKWELLKSFSYLEEHDPRLLQYAY